MTNVSINVLYDNLATLIKDRVKIIELCDNEIETRYLDEAITFLREKINERERQEK